MPVGRYFRALTAYDLLGNLVPGVVMTIAVMGFLSSPPLPQSLGGYGVFTVIAFTVGSVIQAHASEAVGRRNSFEKTITGAERLPSLTEANGTTADGGTASLLSEHAWSWLHPFIGPLAGWRRPPRGEEFDDSVLANRIWEHLIDTHELPFRTDSYSVLYHLMSSRVDDVSSPSRATRLQAIRNFNRGMWLASWYSCVLLVAAFVANQVFTAGEDLPGFGIPYRTPSYFSSGLPVPQLFVISVIGVVVFWLIFESTEDDYLEYLFVDYAIAIVGDENELSLAEGTEIVLSGEIDANLPDRSGGEQSSSGERKKDDGPN